MSADVSMESELISKLRLVKAKREASGQPQPSHSSYLAAWDELRGQIRNHLAGLVGEGLISVIEAGIEAGNGRTATALYVYIVDSDVGTLRLSMYPRDVRAVGIDGLIDVLIGPDRAYCLLPADDERWELYETARRQIVNRAFTAKDVESFLEQLLLSRAVSCHG